MSHNSLLHKGAVVVSITHNEHILRQLEYTIHTHFTDALIASAV